MKNRQVSRARLAYGYPDQTIDRIGTDLHILHEQCVRLILSDAHAWAYMMLVTNRPYPLLS
jgi:hypothetical protein